MLASFGPRMFQRHEVRRADDGQPGRNRITSCLPTIHSEVIPFPNQHTYIYRVQMDPRTFLEYLGAVALTPVLTGSQEANSMWGLIAKITLLPRRHDEMIEILKQIAAGMPRYL